jgi:hypothetical protein
VVYCEAKGHSNEGAEHQSAGSQKEHITRAKINEAVWRKIASGKGKHPSHWLRQKAWSACDLIIMYSSERDVMCKGLDVVYHGMAPPIGRDDISLIPCLVVRRLKALAPRQV